MCSRQCDPSIKAVGLFIMLVFLIIIPIGADYLGNWLLGSDGCENFCYIEGVIYFTLYVGQFILNIPTLSLIGIVIFFILFGLIYLISHICFDKNTSGTIAFIISGILVTGCIVTAGLFVNFVLGAITTAIIPGAYSLDYTCNFATYYNLMNETCFMRGFIPAIILLGGFSIVTGIIVLIRHIIKHRPRSSRPMYQQI